MFDRRVRMVIEVDIDQEALEEHGLSANDIFNHLTFREDDVVDGFLISTNIPDLNPGCHFFLCSGRVISQELLSDRAKETPSLSDQIQSAASRAAAVYCTDKVPAKENTSER